MFIPFFFVCDDSDVVSIELKDAKLCCLKFGLSHLRKRLLYKLLISQPAFVENLQMNPTALELFEADTNIGFNMIWWTVEIRHLNKFSTKILERDRFVDVKRLPKCD